MNEKSIKKWDTRVSLELLGHQSIALKNTTNGNPKCAMGTGFTGNGPMTGFCEEYFLFSKRYFFLAS
jgi:hypothetical protein